MDSENQPVDFGNRRVSPSEKTQLVGSVFRSVADGYDVMNDIMSLGMHRIFKRIAVEYTGLRPGDRALDVAGGTGDVARLMQDVVGSNGLVVLLDINEAMVQIGRDRLLNRGKPEIALVLGDAEVIPFPTASFDALTVCFGLRNMTDKDRALEEMYRVLRPLGRLVVLEFAQPQEDWLASSFRLYQRLWPLFGQAVVGDPQPYRYLIESISKHPSQAALKQMIEDVGFNQVSYENLFGGIVAIHKGHK